VTGKFCPRCGNPTQPTDKFCRNCGHNFVDEAAAAPAEPQPSPPVPSSSKGPPWLPIGIVGAVVVVGAVVALLALGGDDQPVPASVPITELPVAGPATFPSPVIGEVGTASDEQTLRQLFDSQVGWLTTGNAEAFYATVAPERKAQCPEQAFSQEFAGTPEIFGDATFTLSEVTVEGETARVDFVLVRPGGDPISSTNYYVRSSGAWYIDGGSFLFVCP
jgi:hypothetical protein